MTQRVIQTPTPEESVRIDRLSDLAEQDRSEIERQLELYDLAAAEPTFKGAIRRALATTNVPFPELLRSSGISLHELDLFRSGEANLSLDAFERLAQRLGFTLVQAPESVSA